MTTITKIGITGIRSYGEEEQLIKFSKPLTILLGCNGSGKSTIIEAVKMATTGDLPPMVSQGAAFIKDPRINSAPETKAKIRLQFSNVRGENYLVARHFLLRQLHTGKQEFKTIDQTLKKSTKKGGGDEDGRTTTGHSTSHRCAELNALLPEIMRVSKPILNSVIFVHQEDSLWPLGDPKRLKERFDDIFAATRYTKALECIRKYRKEQNADLRVINVELLHHEEYANQCEKLRNEAESIREREAKLRTGVDVIRRDMDDIERDLRRAEKTAEDFATCQRKLTTLEAKVSVLEDDRNRTFEALAEELSELTDDALERLIVDLDDQLRRSEGERRDRTVQLDALRSELAGKSKAHNDAQARRGGLQAEASLQRERIAKLKRFKKAYCTTFLGQREGILAGLARDVLGEESDDEKWNSALQELLRSCEAKLVTRADERRSAEDKVASGVNEVQISLSTLEATIARAKAAAAQKRSAAASRREDLLRVEGSRDSIVLAQAEEVRCKERLDAIIANSTIQETMRKYETLKSDCQSYRSKVLDRKQERIALCRDQDVRVTLDHLRRELAVKQAEVDSGMDTLLEKTHSVCSELGIECTKHMDVSDAENKRLRAVDLLNRITSRRDRMMEEARHTLGTTTNANMQAGLQANEAQNVVDRAKSVFNSSCTMIPHVFGELHPGDIERLGGESGIAKIVTQDGTGGVTVTEQNVENIGDAIGRAERMVDRASKAASLVQYSQLIAENTMQEFESSKETLGNLYQCPTCGTKVAEHKQERVTAMRNFMREKLDKAMKEDDPAALKAGIVEAKATLHWVRKWEDVTKAYLRNKGELESARKNLEAAMTSAAQRENTLLGAEEALQSLQEQFAPGCAFQEAETLREDLIRKGRDCERLNTEVRKLTAMLPVETASQSVCDIDGQIQDLEDLIQQSQDNMDKTRRELDMAKDERSSSEARYRNAKETRLELEQSFEKRRRLEAERDELTQGIRVLESEIASGRENCVVLEGDLILAKEKLRTLRAENCRVATAESAESARLSRAIADWNSVYSAAQTYVSMGKDQILMQLERHSAKVAEEIEQLQKDVAQLTKEAETTSDTLRFKDTQAQNARENKRYRNLKSQLNVYQAQRTDARRDVERLCTEASRIASEAATSARIRLDHMEAAVHNANVAGSNVKEAAEFGSRFSMLDRGRDAQANPGAALGTKTARLEPMTVVENMRKQLHQKDAWCHATEGKAQVFTERWRLKMVEIREAESKGSRRKYEECRIKKQTIELALSDLDRYHRALDQALMAYHTLKMDDINKTIKELWQLTYRGQDIDEIEIVSDAMDTGRQGTTSGGTGTGGGKRNYNYRVVMRRGDALLDMRGRCSAGQKVLACLVIRLALAESFCSDCGILALDEPTTNLDKENVESLAKALRDIIENRRQQAHFQLILISHDSEFLNSMQARAYCDSYYLIRKDADGNSVGAVRAPPKALTRKPDTMRRRC